MPKTLRGLKRVFFRYWTTTGPREILAGLELDYVPSDQFEFNSKVVWPSDDYSQAVQDEIKKTLNSLCEHPLAGKFTLTEIHWDDVGSSEVSFRTATREAVRSIFSMSEVVDYAPVPL